MYKRIILGINSYKCTAPDFSVFQVLWILEKPEDAAVKAEIFLLRRILWHYLKRCHVYTTSWPTQRSEEDSLWFERYKNEVWEENKSQIFQLPFFSSQMK